MNGKRERERERELIQISIIYLVQLIFNVLQLIIDLILLPKFVLVKLNIMELVLFVMTILISWKLFMVFFINF